MSENQVEGGGKESESREYVKLTESEQKITVEQTEPQEEETQGEDSAKNDEPTGEEPSNEPKIIITTDGTDGGEEKSYDDDSKEKSYDDNNDVEVDKIDEIEAIKEENEENDVLNDLEEEEANEYDREELIRRYNEAVAERESLSGRHSNAQNKIAEYFSRKKNEGQSAGGDAERPSADQDQNYVKALMQLQELKDRYDDEEEHLRNLIDEVKVLMKDKELFGCLENSKACDYQRNICSRAVFERTGRVITTDQFKELEQNDKKKEKEVMDIRLENIKLKNRLAKLEEKLRKKEQLAEGLHLIDFEQLKIENQTYNEKIEERNEELIKLRKKITDTVQVLTHLKEKMQFIQVENTSIKEELMKVESKVARRRDVISHTKHARDALRTSNSKLRIKSGLLGKKDLLLDYDESYTLQNELRQKIEQLKRQHAELTLNIKGVRQKIDMAKN